MPDFSLFWFVAGFALGALIFGVIGNIVTRKK